MLMKNDMYVEQSSGLAINYGDKELGMNKEMLKKEQKCAVMAVCDQAPRLHTALRFVSHQLFEKL